MLASCFALQILSIAGFLPKITAFLPSIVEPSFQGIAVGLTFFSLLGLLAGMGNVARYSTIVVSVFIITLSAFSLIITFAQQTTFYNVVIPFLAPTLLGFFSIACTFLSGAKEPAITTLTDIQTSASDSNEYAIETINANKTYALGSNSTKAVDNINLKVKKGDFIAIMGPSGSGKSTFLNLIGALDKPSSGQILIDGTSISDLNENQLARLRNEKIGFVFQAYNLVARSTVKRNMELPALVKGYSKETRDNKIFELLKTVQLSNKISVKPKTLSGGEQQRVAVARALINDPEIILADEPTGNLDSNTGRAIIEFLRKLNSERKTTVVLVTHDPEVAKKTNRIIYFRDGHVIKDEITGAGMLYAN